MSGFIVKPKTYRLKFDDPEYAGAVVRCRSVPVGQFMRIAELAELAEEADGAKQAGELFRAFASALIEWNLQEDSPIPGGEPIAIPADQGGLYRLDLEFALMLIQAWMQATSSVDPSLGKGSTSGATSEVALIPMEPLSPNRPS